MSILLIQNLLQLAAISLALGACARIPVPRPRLYRLLFIMIVVDFIVEVAGSITTYFDRNNTAMYNFAFTTQFLVVLLMIRAEKPGWTRRLAMLAAVGLGAMGANLWVNGSLSFLLTEGMLVIGVMLSVALLALLWDLANTSDTPLQHVPEFWLNMGLLVYFGGMAPMVGLLRFIYMADPQLANRLWNILPMLAITCYLLIFQACRLRGRYGYELNHG